MLTDLYDKCLVSPADLCVTPVTDSAPTADQQIKFPVPYEYQGSVSVVGEPISDSLRGEV